MDLMIITMRTVTIVLAGESIKETEEVTEVRCDDR